MDMDDTSSRSDRPKKRHLWAIIAVGATLVVIPAGLWLGRISLTEAVVGKYCSDRDVKCELSIETLELNKIRIADIRLEKDNAAPISLESLDIDVIWPKLFAPELKSVSAKRPKLVIDTRQQHVRIDILDSFQSGKEGSGSSMALPPFSIEDGQFTILTDAGPVRGQVTTAGSLDREIQSRIVLEPAELSMNGHELVLQEGTASFVLAQSRVSGDARLKLKSAVLEGVKARDINVLLQVEPGDDNHYAFNWDIDADDLQQENIQLSDFSTKGVAALTWPGEFAVENVKVMSVTGELQSQTFVSEQAALKDLEVLLDLQAGSTGLTGPVSVQAEHLASPLAGSAKELIVTGDLTTKGKELVPDSVAFVGAVSLAHGALEDVHKNTVTTALALPDPLDLHSKALQESLSDLLSDFSTGIQIQAAYDVKNSSYTLESSRALVMQTADKSISVRVRPEKSRNWLNLDGSSLTIAGDVEYFDQNKNLTLTMQRSQIGYGLKSGDMSLRFHSLLLDEWDVDKRKVDVTLGPTNFAKTSSSGRFSTNGQVRFSGPAFGAELQNATINGAFAGLESKDGWMIRISDSECFDFGIASAELADIRIDPVSARFCAPGGRLFDREKDDKGKVVRTFGELTTQALKLPLRHPSATADMRLQSPNFTWSAGDKIQLTMLAKSMTNSILLPDQDSKKPHSARTGEVISKFTLDNDNSYVDIHLKNILADIVDAPIAVSAASWDAEGEVLDTGPDLNWRLSKLEISDSLNPKTNALFNPLETSGSGKLTADGVVYSGPLKMVSREAEFGLIQLQHDFKSNRGSASLTDGEITLARKGLQLHHISERLRGLAVNSTGTIKPEVHAAWVDGVPSAKGNVEITDISFSSFSLGQFQGLSGEIEFSDLINMRTPPGQKFTLQRLALSPSLALDNGEFSIQLTNASLIHLEKVSWPFVDGHLSIDPAWWELDNTRHELTVRAEAWSLDRLTTMFKVPDLKVNGTVSGAFPIVIDGADIFLRNARLDAIDDGSIKYGGDIGQQAGQSNPYAKMAFDALRNFDYEVLSLGANGNLLDNILLEMSISGSNKDVLKGQTFNLNISLESKLAELIQGSSYATSATATKDAVVKILKERGTVTDN